MNDRGYVTAGILVVILLFAMLYLVIIYGGVINTTKDVAEVSKLSETLVKDLNGKERMYQTLLDNPSFEGEKSYEDLDKEYVVETIDETYELGENLIYSDGGTFEIKNKTPINIVVNVVPDNPEVSYSYNLEVINDEKDMLNGMGLNKASSLDYTINDYEVYDHETDTSYLGEYEVKLTDINNAFLTVEITYNQMTERIVSLTDNMFEKEITITIEDNKVELMEGG